MSQITLTDRQTEALEWISQGHSINDVAILMGITMSGVNGITQTVRYILGVKSTLHAVVKARQLGMIK